MQATLIIFFFYLQLKGPNIYLYNQKIIHNKWSSLASVQKLFQIMQHLG